MAVSIIRNLTHSTITLPVPYLGFVVPGGGVLVPDTVDVAIAHLGGAEVISSILSVEAVDPSFQSQADPNKLQNVPIGGVSIGNESATATGRVKFFELLPGTNYVSLRAPLSIPVSYDLTLPNSDGNPGQVLATDGFGGLFFTDSGASTGWSLSANILAGTEKFGSSNSFDVPMVRNNVGIVNLSSTGFTFQQTSSLLSSSASTGSVTMSGGPATTGGTLTVNGPTNVGSAGTAQLAGTSILFGSPSTANTKVLIDGNSLSLKQIDGTAGNTVQLRFFEDTPSGGTTFVSFKAPANIPSNVFWTLPSADGTNGQSLTTNGAGVLSWVSVGAGQNWSLAGNTLAGTEIFGSLNAQDVVMRRNNTNQIVLTSTGIEVFNTIFRNATNNSLLLQGGTTGASLQLSGSTAGTPNNAAIIGDIFSVTTTGSVVLLSVDVTNGFLIPRTGTAPQILKFLDFTTGTNFVGFQAPTTVTSSATYRLPPAGATAANQFLANDGSQNLSWQSLTTFSWGLQGNTVGATDFIGTNNAQDFVIKSNTAERIRFDHTSSYMRWNVDTVRHQGDTGQLQIFGGETPTGSLPGGAIFFGQTNPTTPGRAHIFGQQISFGFDLTTASIAIDSVNMSILGDVKLTGGDPTAALNIWGSVESNHTQSGAHLSLTGGSSVTPEANAAILQFNRFFLLDTTGSAKVIFDANSIALLPFGASAGNTRELRFNELAANGAQYVGWKAPDSINANVIWTLPPADGTAGQVLSTNGAGITSWVANGSGANWALSGNAIPTGSEFLGTTNSFTLIFKQNNQTKMELVNNQMLLNTTFCQRIGNTDRLEFIGGSSGASFAVWGSSSSFPNLIQLSGSSVRLSGTGSPTVNTGANTDELFIGTGPTTLGAFIHLTGNAFPSDPNGLDLAGQTIEFGGNLDHISYALMTLSRFQLNTMTTLVTQSESDTLTLRGGSTTGGEVLCRGASASLNAGGIDILGTNLNFGAASGSQSYMQLSSTALQFNSTLTVRTSADTDILTIQAGPTIGPNIQINGGLASNPNEITLAANNIFFESLSPTSFASINSRGISASQGVFIGFNQFDTGAANVLFFAAGFTTPGASPANTCFLYLRGNQLRVRGPNNDTVIANV